MTYDPDYDRLRVSMDFGKWDPTAGMASIRPSMSATALRRKGGISFICFYDLWKITQSSLR